MHQFGAADIMATILRVNIAPQEFCHGHSGEDSREGNCLAREELVRE